MPTTILPASLILAGSLAARAWSTTAALDDVVSRAAGARAAVGQRVGAAGGQGEGGRGGCGHREGAGERALGVLLRGRCTERRGRPGTMYGADPATAARLRTSHSGNYRRCGMMHTAGNPRAQRTPETHTPRPRTPLGPRAARQVARPSPRGSRPWPRRPTPRSSTRRPGLPRPRGRQARGARHQAAARPRRPVAALHAGGRRGLAGPSRPTRAPARLHEPGQHGRRRQRRHRGARAGRHRSARRHAGDGGQGGAVQALRRRRRRAGVHGDRHASRSWSRRSSRIAPTYGGINLEDISAPRCFEIERAAPGAARHPGVPRRPARHGDRGARRPAQRREGRRPDRSTCGWSSPAPARPASR